MDTTREQFEKEAAALVDLMRSMIDAGQLSDASMLLEQYSLLNPGDPQIAELRNALRESEKGVQASQKQIGHDDPFGDNYQFLKHTESIFVLAGIITKRSGFYTSIYNKIRLMEERLSYNSVILTCRHDINLRKTEVWLKTFTDSSEILSPKTRILNVYEYFQKSYKEGLKNKAVYENTKSDEGFRVEMTSEGTYTIYDGKMRIREDVYSGYSGSLRIERYYKDEKKDKEYYYDDWGYLNCIRQYDPKNGKIYTAHYYTTDGELCLRAVFDESIEELEPQKVFRVNDKGEQIAEFSCNEELAAYYLSETMCDTDDDGEDLFYLLVFETGTVAKICDWLDNSRKNMAKISVIHSIFLKNAYNPSSGPQSYYEYVCNNPAMMDGIVFLTEAAKRDFNNLYGCHKTTFVIPHPYPYEIERVDFEQRDNRKAVVISRLFPEKQIDLTIDIFSMVVKELPDARLEIYGIGPEQEAIEKYIKKRGMENNIFMMGYTDDAISIYRTAVIHIMTSIAEGYGLTLMESICNGCPAFSLDMKYGPADIIKQGKTGFLFPLGDTAGYARKIIEFFKDGQMQLEMSENCYADAPRFSRDDFLKKWLNMVKELINVKEKETK